MWSFFPFVIVVFQWALAVELPAPDTHHRVKNFSKIVAWPKNKKPQVPPGFRIEVYAKDLQSPRWIYVLPNGDVLVAEAKTKMKVFKKLGAKLVGADKSESQSGDSVNRITLFRDKNKDGKPEVRQIFLQGLNQPFGMALIGNWFYVANTDSIWRYPYKKDHRQISAHGEKIKDLPEGGQHWTRNLIADPVGKKLYVAVGSSTNIADHGIDKEQRRANILQMNLDGTEEKVFASGLRNPVGMDWAPGTEVLWTVVNERDNLGENLVPDFLTSVKEDGFYGWPYFYFGSNVDPRMKGQGQEYKDRVIVPEVDLGSHTASLGLAFYRANSFPNKYQNGAFIGQHGSWNRKELAGYKVVFVPFKNGKPSGPPEDFVTGFIADSQKSQVYGRPVGVTMLGDGSLLIADDAADLIWRVKYSRSP
jgi:glucose/arabinose dehydrogenase